MMMQRNTFCYAANQSHPVPPPQFYPQPHPGTLGWQQNPVNRPVAVPYHKGFMYDGEYCPKPQPRQVDTTKSVDIEDPVPDTPVTFSRVQNTRRVELFVDNLDDSVDDKRLCEEFRPFGLIVDAKVVMENGRSKGFGFVSFSSMMEATMAIEEMNGAELENMTLYVALSDGREERQVDPALTEQRTIPTDELSDTEEAVPSTPPSPTALTVGEGVDIEDPVPDTPVTFSSIQNTRRVELFVDNLDDSVDDKRLCEEFRPFGLIIDAKVVMENGRSKGFGFVSFSSMMEATMAIEEMNGAELENMILYVALSDGREERQVDPALTEQRTIPTDELSDTEEAEPSTPPSPTALTVGESVDIEDPVPDTPVTFSSVQNTRRVELFIDNLDDSVDDKRLCEEFRPFGLIIDAKVVMENGRSKGFGFVSFSSMMEATMAIEEMNGAELENMTLYVALSDGREERQVDPALTEQRTIPTDELSDTEEAEPSTPPSPTALTVGESVDIEDPVPDTPETFSIVQNTWGVKLFVGNLDYSVRNKRLYEEFLPFGHILDAKVVMEKGRSKGFGFVTLLARNEATIAIEKMNGAKLGKKTLHVALSESKEEQQLDPAPTEQSVENSLPTTPQQTPFNKRERVQPQHEDPLLQRPKRRRKKKRNRSTLNPPPDSNTTDSTLSTSHTTEADVDNQKTQEQELMDTEEMNGAELKNMTLHVTLSDGREERQVDPAPTEQTTECSQPTTPQQTPFNEKERVQPQREEPLPRLKSWLLFWKRLWSRRWSSSKKNRL